MNRFFKSIAILSLTLPLLATRSIAQNLEVNDISFVDESHGWALVTGQTPGVYRTTDGGKSWVPIPLPSNHIFYRAYFFDQNTGVALQIESEKTTAIYRTEDAGSTWKKVSTIEWQHGEHLDGVTLTSRNEGFVVGERSGGRGYVGQLLDGGRTVRARSDLPVDFDEQSNALAAFGDGTGQLWIVGKELILHSADYGKTWENQYPNSTPRIDLGMAGTTLPGGHAWIAVANFQIYRTEDYGKHWVRALSTANDGYVNFQSISFSDVRDGCAVGNSPYVYCTNDGGVTWSKVAAFKQYPNGSPFFSKILLFSSSHGWATNNGALYKTEDGGRSFKEVLTSSRPVESGIPGELEALKTSVNGPTELAYDSAGYLYIVESMQGRLLRLDLKHESLKVVLPDPSGGSLKDFGAFAAIATDQHGTVYIADHKGRLRKLDTRTGDVSVLLAAPPRIIDSQLEAPQGMAMEANGDLLIVGQQHHRLFQWRPGSGELETVAGGGTGVDGELAPIAALRFPAGVAVDATGNIFIADYQHCRIRKIDAKTNIITTIAGTGECASKGDGGPATNAAVNYPSSMAADSAGNLFFVEGATDRVRRIDKNGFISTYAGTGQKGFGGDGGPADKAMLSNPSGIAVDPDGNLYISEFVNNRIRRVDAITRVITTIAGNGGPGRVDSVM